MEARFFSAALIAVSLLSLGASYPTQNFIIHAPTPEIAQAIGQAGERYRRDLSLEWLGRELPPWQDPCPIRVHVGQHLGAGGATSFMFDDGRPFGWQMTIQGSYERLLDSVLPHEITHMILATHFGRPLPRWADEGAATSVEHTSEKAKQQRLLINFLTTGRGIDAITDYGVDTISDDIVPYFSGGDYANGFARFLHDVDVFLKQFQSGKPYDVNNRVQLRSPVERATGIAVYLMIAAAVIAGIVLLVMILGMKTARP